MGSEKRVPFPPWVEKEEEEEEEGDEADDSVPSHDDGLICNNAESISSVKFHFSTSLSASFLIMTPPEAFYSLQHHHPLPSSPPLLFPFFLHVSCHERTIASFLTSVCISSSF